MMLDLAIAYCNKQLGKQLVLYEPNESGAGEISDNGSNSSDDSVSGAIKSDSSHIRFHVFVPPELLTEKCQIGIVSSLNNWDTSEMNILNTDLKLLIYLF